MDRYLIIRVELLVEKVNVEVIGMYANYNQALSGLEMLPELKNAIFSRICGYYSNGQTIYQIVRLNEKQFDFKFIKEE